MEGLASTSEDLLNAFAGEVTEERVAKREIHVCPIHVTMKDSVRFQVQISNVPVPLVGKATDVKSPTNVTLTLAKMAALVPS